MKAEVGDRIVVERQEAGEKTKGGIILPDAAKEKPQIGKVIAVGDGKLLKDGKRKELQVKKGDSILFTSYAGDEFKLSHVNTLDDFTQASPALVGERLLIRTEHKLYSIRRKA